MLLLTIAGGLILGLLCLAFLPEILVFFVRALAVLVTSVIGLMALHGARIILAQPSEGIAFMAPAALLALGVWRYWWVNRPSTH